MHTDVIYISIRIEIFTKVSAFYTIPPYTPDAPNSLKVIIDSNKLPNNFPLALQSAIGLFYKHKAKSIKVTRWGTKLALIHNETEALDALFQSCKW